MPMDKALKFASIWLLNPMVATISTRGSSEGLLAAMVVALVWAVMQRRIVLASVLLGVGVHFKIYPFIYAPSIVWWLDDEQLQFQPKATQGLSLWGRARKFCNGPRITLACLSFGTFVTLNLAMFYM
jgi:phosphatidylinositol glycan class M